MARKAMRDGPEDALAMRELETCYTPAAWEALAEFPIDVESVEFVDHSENVTFRVKARDRVSDYVLRLHRPGYNSLRELESEREWISALVAAGISVPEPLKTRDGAHFTAVDIAGADERRQVGMTTWRRGMPLYRCTEVYADERERRRILRRIGEIAAEMHNQAASWDVPPGFTRPRLDLDGLLGDEPRWGRFWEHTKLPEGGGELLLATRDKLRAVLGEYPVRDDNFSLIHADFDSDNIIYDDGELALIDFDDSAFGWHMYDIASALIEYCSDADFDVLCDAFVEGYREHRPLAIQDTEMLPLFLLVRGMAIVGWYHDRPEYAASDDFEMVKNWVLGQCKSVDL